MTQFSIMILMLKSIYRIQQLIKDSETNDEDSALVEKVIFRVKVESKRCSGADEFEFPISR
jgi:hypothetical protein